MRLLHTLCLHRLTLQKRTIVSQPADRSWPKDFELSLPWCDTCRCFPPIEEIKKEAGE